MDLSELSQVGMQAPRAVPEATAGFQLRDAPAGWAIAPGYPKWQVVQDVMYPWDPEVVRRMREVDPQIVPLWVTWAYTPPKEDANKDIFVTGRHAVGWHMPNHPSQDFHTLMPLGPIHGMHFKRPTRLWKIYHVAEETSDRIGGFVPWGWWMYYNLLDEFREVGVPTMTDYVEGKRAAMEVRKSARIAEQAYLQSQVSPFIQKKLDGVPDAVWKKWLAGGHRERPTRPSIVL